jgi:hypothetical protein
MTPNPEWLLLLRVLAWPGALRRVIVVVYVSSEAGR